MTPCPRCRDAKEGGDRFCPYCGTMIGNGLFPFGMGAREWFFLAGAGCAIIVILIMIYEAAAGWVLAGRVMEDVEGWTYPVYYITPDPKRLFDISGMQISALYIIEAIIVTVCVGCLIFKCIGCIKRNKDETMAVRDSALFKSSTLFCAMFVFELAYIIACKMKGLDLGEGISSDSGRMIFQLMNASVYEEFLCRVLMIGFPVMIIAILLKKKDKPLIKYILGGCGFEGWMAVFVLFSSCMFALGHLDSWGWWKIAPTLAFGLVTGYVFIRYGVYATIALHFLNDFLSSPQWLGQSGTGIVLLLMLAGALAVASLGYDLFSYTRERLKGSDP